MKESEVTVSFMSFHGLIMRFFLTLSDVPQRIIFSPTERHPDCLQVLAIMNKVAVNMYVIDFGYT